MSLRDQGMRLLDDLRHEMSLPQQERETRAHDAELEIASDLVHGMMDALKSGDVPTFLLARNLGRLTTDSWNVSAPLSRDLSEFEVLFHRAIKIRGKRGL